MMSESSGNISKTSQTNIVNPNVDLGIPKWVNAEFFEPIVCKDIEGFEKILKLIPIAAIPPGENFTSIMVRVHMDILLKDGSQQHKSYILKTMLDDDKGGKLINEMDLFPKEMAMYAEFLPQFEHMYAQAGHNVKLNGKCLFSEKNNNRIVVVFEDLSIKGFKNVGRLKGCDMQHMRLTLRKLAEFHAASVVYEQKHGPFPKDFDNGFVNPKMPDFLISDFHLKKAEFIKYMTSWGLEDADKYINKFPTADQYLKCALRTLKSEENSFNVLTHGDFWTSNVMFNYAADNSVQECMLVDFQLCKWGSPAEDLLFFITISAAKDIRIKEFDHFVEIYHERLIECLRILKYEKPLPSLRSIHRDLFNPTATFYALFAVINHLPAVMLPSDKESSIHSIRRDDEVGETFRKRLFTNPLFVECMQDWLPFYFRKGLFSFEEYDE